MEWAPLLLLLVYLAELLVWLPGIWRLRAGVVPALILVHAVVAGLLVGATPNAGAAIIAALSAYQIVNFLRIVQHRMHADRLYHVTRRTGLWIVGLSVVVMATMQLLQWSQIGVYGVLVLIGVAQLAAVSGIYNAYRIAMLRSAPLKDLQGIPERSLPTLTVAIPARNETDDLEACLLSLVQSTYPKLEIIVLDDCSQDKHTPDIIRRYAHEGVRFIAGEAPPENWLAKNYAYKQLAEAANGKIVLFCGVDVRFSPTTLTTIVKTFAETKSEVMSVMPHNVLPKRRRLLAAVYQANRYAWELCTPPSLFNRPAVLSTCWLLKKDALQRGGGFDAVRHSILPERYFARQAASQSAYHFMRSGDNLGLNCEKQPAAQRHTAIRTRYPQLHRRPEFVGVVSLAELGVVVAPFGSLLYGIATQAWLLAGISLPVIVLSGMLYRSVVRTTYGAVPLGAAALLPFAMLYDIAVLHYSMWQYEFSEVIWKGRNVCLPVMEAPARASSGAGYKS